MAIYGIPYRLTGLLENLARPPADVRGTFKLLVGAAIHLVWTIVVVALAAWRFGALAAAAAAVAMPLVGVTALHVVERWRSAVGEARRFLLRTRRREVLGELRQRQRDLAERLHRLWEEVRV
jgi:hypothetical protein